MQTELHVTFEQAKLLKEKGFNDFCSHYFENGVLTEPQIENGSSTDLDFIVEWSDFLENYNSLYYNKLSAPFQDQVVRWLRVKHNIWVLIAIEEIRYSCNYVIKWRDNIGPGETIGTSYETPEDAYSAALDYILKTLI